MKPYKIGLLMLAGFGCLTIASTVWADEEGSSADLIKERAYVGGILTYDTIDQNGDINGRSALIDTNPSSYELDLIPSIDRSFGFGGLAGYRMGAYAMEVSYWRSSHNTAWGPNSLVPITFTGTALYQSLNLDLKRYILTQFPTQPFFSLGIAFPWLVYKNASADGFGNVGDFSLSGLGFNLGAGLEIYLGKDFSIIGAAVNRWSGFTGNQGITKNISKSDIQTYSTTHSALEGDGLNFYVAGTVAFGN